MSRPASLTRHSVGGPYRDRRESLLVRRRRIASELDAARRAADTAPHLARHLAAIDAELDDESAPLPDEIAARAPSPLPRSVRAAQWLAECVIAGTSAGAIFAVILMIGGGVVPAGASLDAMPRSTLERDHAVATPPPALHRPSPTPGIDRPVTTAAIAADEAVGLRALDRHVRWIAPQTWEIDRGLVDLALRGEIPLRGPRVVPVIRDGTPLGVRVHGVRRGALAGRLGLENGDIVLDVNGLSLAAAASLDGARRLADADALFVRIERRGEERLHVYRIIG